jgi:hypothetical protein
LESLLGIDHSEDLGADERIILKRVSGKQVWTAWTGLIWLGIGTYNGLLETW